MYEEIAGTRWACGSTATDRRQIFVHGWAVVGTIGMNSRQAVSAISIDSD